jgi:hypothetical protein
MPKLQTQPAATHSPEPWTCSGQAILQDAGGTIIADCEIVTDTDAQDVTPDLENANARRIVAAVNACQGVPTNALEQGAVRKLLAALEGLIHYDWPEELDDSVPWDSNVWANAHAAAALASKSDRRLPTAPPALDLPVSFDAYEIHGIRAYGRGSRRHYQQVADSHAQFWSLFGHIPGQGLDCIGDFATREHAEGVFARITGRPYTEQPHDRGRCKP